MRLVVGVSGSIAAYKACDLVSKAVQAGHLVRVIMTPTATQFVGPLTFSALSGHSVVWETTDQVQGSVSHVALANWAEALIVAPATAALLSRLAQGEANDMLTLTYLGFRGPVLLAPAMEPKMWEHPATQRNVTRLKEDGVHLVGPNVGHVASGEQGRGRMAEPLEILEALRDATAKRDLTGIRMVITAGATWEHFDPVRLLTNPSTGMMGVMLADQAAIRGAQVVLVAGPSVNLPIHPKVDVYRVTSAQDMLDSVLSVMESAQVFIGAAAVSDFRPAQRQAHKVHKDALLSRWDMVANPDIIRTVAERYRGQKLIVGFAAETEQVQEQAERKRTQKGLDAVVANRVGVQEGFGDLPHEAWLVTKQGVQPLPGHDKRQTATAVLDWIRESLRGS